MWSGEHNLEFGKEKWDGNAPLRAVILRGLRSIPCTSHGPGGLFQEPPAGSGPCPSKGNQEESGSHAGPPAQLLMSFPLLFIDLIFWEQLLPSHFRFHSVEFSSLHLLMTCLQLLLLLL